MRKEALTCCGTAARRENETESVAPGEKIKCRRL
eukprot:gene915-997_t